MENYEVEYTSGGSTQNSIRVCQWMVHEPKTASFIGCVGASSSSCSDGRDKHRERRVLTLTSPPPTHTLSTRTQQPHASFALSGKDDYSAALRKAAEGAKVNVAYMEDESTPTGTVAHKSIHPARNLPHSHTHTHSHIHSHTHILTHSHTHIRLAMCSPLQPRQARVLCS